MSRNADGRDTRRSRVAATAALVVAILGITWSAIFIRWAGIPGPSSAFYRVLIASAVLVPWWVATLAFSPHVRAKIVNADRRAILLALAGGTLFAIDLALYNTAVLRTTATSATLLGNNAPIFVGLGTWLLFKRRPERTFWIGLGLALVGAAIVMFVSPTNASHRPRALSGDLLALSASVFFAGYLLTTERVREELDTLSFSTVAILGSVATLYISCRMIGAPLGDFSGQTWLALFGLGVISQLAAYFAIVYALGQLPATVTSVSLLAQVPLTALLAVPLLGEPIGVSQVVGGALVLAGIYIVTKGKEQPPQ